MEERETVKSADGGRISRLTTRRPYPLCLSTGRKCARWIKRLIRGILPLISTMDERIIELSIVIEFESIYYKKKEEKEKRERERERESHHDPYEGKESKWKFQYLRPIGWEIGENFTPVHDDIHRFHPS